MDFGQLRQLVAIADEETMSAAADVLRMPQPTLSRSIRRLEDDFGFALFDRVGRKVTLNDAGRTAVEWARQLLRDEQLMREAVETSARQTQMLRVGTVAPAPLWRLTALLVERFPRETLTSRMLDQQGIIHMMSNGTLDLGIIEANIPSAKPKALRDAGLRSCPLMVEELSIILPPSHPLAAYKSLTAAQLDRETFLIMTDIGFWRQRVDHALPHATFIEQNDSMVFSQLAHSSPYCMFITNAPFRGDPPAGRVIVPFDDPAAHADFLLVTRDSARSMALELFDWVNRT
ncbi:LysR family transcriptional regulator [Bifidobacterium catenulatum]|uniref:LysR family transcriptional regulator n=1 Tax=Bifidobacterium catenulatum TaxID=1686 RepID=UPI0012AF50E2|nr:LysR family transcriptional regulator [Bifidobacterium catenulatum]MDH7880418.1 LysR family transcriptional regulator [Bifidobacterium catenulatum subsp. kashiwanohense]QGM62218.1 transcriptional regulator [Bifidobacterium catenulatum subsp. kashiwanohense]